MAAKNSKTPECFCCLEPYNKTTRYPVACENYLDNKTSCSFVSCRACTRRYILGSGCTAQCMNCKKAFSRHFLIENLTRNWTDGDYALYKNSLLLDTEKARCPENIEEASNFKKVIPLEKKNRNLKLERRKLEMKARELSREIGENQTKINDYRNFRTISVQKEKKKFIRRCPVENCKGFLSTRWKCELCNATICNKCLEVKIIAEDEDEEAICAVAEHVCTETNLQMAELLKKDTKPCPSCGEMITKISGCDQMWCPSCKNAWSWTRGVVVHGVIHNPHYYQFQRQINNGNIPRNLGDVPCGGLPTYYNWRMKVLHSRATHTMRMSWNKAVRELFHNTLMNLHRKANHYQYVIINPLMDKVTHLRDNKILRVMYMVDQLGDESFKKQLGQRNVEVEKITSTLQIYQLFNTILTENIISIYNIKRPQDNSVQEWELVEVARCLKNIEDARIYVNKELSKIAFLYKRAIKIISPQYNLSGRQITSKKSLQRYLDYQDTEKPQNINNFLPERLRA